MKAKSETYIDPILRADRFDFKGKPLTDEDVKKEKEESEEEEDGKKHAV